MKFSPSSFRSNNDNNWFDVFPQNAGKIILLGGWKKKKEVLLVINSLAMRNIKNKSLLVTGFRRMFEASIQNAVHLKCDIVAKTIDRIVF